MIQDISPYKIDNHYYPQERPDESSRFVCFRGPSSDREILVKELDKAEEIQLPGFFDISKKEREKAIYLFKIDEEKLFLLPGDVENCERETNDSGPETALTYTKLTALRRSGMGPRHLIFALYTAYHLNEWYEGTRFCGKCGHKTQHDTLERAIICPECGHKVYPRINPAVIIGVIDREDNKILLTKYRTGFAQNALVAGFTEIGETLEETVKREVQEEVGLKVKNIRYYKSQPWGVALDILAGFFCEVEGDKEIKMDESELKYAEWVSPEDVILQVPDYSLTNEMMRLFKEKGASGV